MNDPGRSSCDSYSGISIDIATESALWDGLPEAARLAREAVAAALRQAAAELPAEAEISLLLCDDAFIQGLNARWRGQDKPTNVLSFPAADADSPILGDIVIAFETLAREAVDEGKGLRPHFSHLVVHGLLHLLGYDHQDEAEAEEMEQLERESLAALGVDDPYRLAVIDGCP